MKRFFIELLCVFVSLFVTIGCHEKEEYVEIDPDYIFKPDSLKMQGQYIIIAPKLPFDYDFYNNSRDYYQSADTMLTFKGDREKMSYEQKKSEGWCLLDWRIKSISVITLVDYDTSHPKGSSLNDLLGIKYWYKFTEVEKPLSNFEYGDLMLGDYYPYQNQWSPKQSLFLFFLNRETPWFTTGTYEIQIEDAFGRTIVLKQ